MPDGLDLDALKALTEGATEGPWEVGNRYLVCGLGGPRFAGSECASCHHGPPIWAGRRDINGTIMDAHEHVTAEPWYDDPTIVGGRSPHVEVVHGSDDRGDNLSRADAAFIAAARTAVPALIAEVERLRRDLEEVAGRLVGYKRLYNQALTEVADATEQGAAWMDEARRQAAERDREFQRAEQAGAERDRRGDELRRAQAVIDAAKVWRNTEQPDWYIADADERALIAAVDALEAPVPP